MVLASHWQLDASFRQLWPLLADVERWPTWWPAARAARTALRAPAGPVGDVSLLRLRGALPVDLRLMLTTVSLDEAGLLEWHTAGDLDSRLAWVLEPGTRGGVDLTCRWELAPATWPWRGVAQLSRRLFEWNHFGLVRCGAQGLAKALHARAGAVSEWAGSRRP